MTMEYTRNLRVHESGEEATDVASAWFEVDRFNRLLCFLRVTAIKTHNNETFDVKMQMKDPDGNTVDVSSGTFTQVTSSTGNEYKAFSMDFGSQIRFYYTFTGDDPGYTFTLMCIAKALV